MPLTIYDISRKAGVSIATVSRVLNNSDLVSEKTRRRVLDVIARSGYTPNIFARGLGLNTMHTIGLLCANVSDPPIARAVFYLQRFLRLNGYDSMLLCTEDDLDVRRKAVSQLLSKHVDAIVLCGSYFVENDDARNDYLREAAAKVPVVLLIGALSAPGLYSILPDDRLSEKQAVECLLRRGCRRVLHLYHSASYAGQRKIEGCRDALADANLIADEALFLPVPNADEPEKLMQCALDALRAARESGLTFDGVAASNDVLAVAALKDAQARGIAVPEQMQIIGFDATTAALCATPALSTVDTHLEDVCHACVATLLAVLDGQDAPPLQLFPGTLILRETTSGVLAETPDFPGDSAAH